MSLIPQNQHINIWRTEEQEVHLRSARALIVEALTLLDLADPPMAAATLDLALHQLDGELRG